ncbi:hypothetical protein KSP40_PGU007153 [Platanthera guangdongensis]|uniref:Uncharacterized protein n=1 Tax=Platanthera guangdongensis TaxID=2320717 RepID=A0ABR2LX86_9ASPA
MYNPVFAKSGPKTSSGEPPPIYRDVPPLSAFCTRSPSFCSLSYPFRIPSSLLGSSPIPFSASEPPLHFRRRNFSTILASIGKEGTELRFSGSVGADLEVDDKEAPSVSGDLAEDASPEELEYIRQINRVSLSLSPYISYCMCNVFVVVLTAHLLMKVLELLKKNRDMLFDEVRQLSYSSLSSVCFLRKRNGWDGIPISCRTCEFLFCSSMEIVLTES